jgi:hypothetical protein
MQPAVTADDSGKSRLRFFVSREVGHQRML